MPFGIQIESNVIILYMFIFLKRYFIQDFSSINLIGTHYTLQQLSAQAAKGIKHFVLIIDTSPFQMLQMNGNINVSKRQKNRKEYTKRECVRKLQSSREGSVHTTSCFFQCSSLLGLSLGILGVLLFCNIRPFRTDVLESRSHKRTTKSGFGATL